MFVSPAVSHPLHRQSGGSRFAGRFQSKPRGSAASSGASPAAPLRIGIFGLFGSGNLGNDGSLESFLAFLRSAHPDAELHSICSGTESVAERFGLPTLPIQSPAPRNRWLKILNTLSLRTLFRAQEWVWTIRAARRLDLVVVPGTGMLDDFGERWRDMPYHLFRWGLACRLAGTPFAFASIGAGPIQHPLSRWLMRSAAAMARFRSYRDANSKNYMDGIGLHRPDDAVTPDLAFRLALPLPAPPSAGGRRVIGVGMMGYAGWKHSQADGQAIYAAYTAKMTQFVAWLIGRGYGVRLIMGDEGDIPALNDVSTAIGEAPGGIAAHLVAEPAGSLTEIMCQIGDTELLVATRFHNVVCGLMMGKPVISLSYARKNDVLLDEMGLGEFCQHIETFNLDRLKAQFERLIRDREDYVPGIVQKTAQYREQLAEQEKHLLAALR
jgi:polysaccharide pyruvyl transferase WcaK-like protein